MLERVTLDLLILKLAVFFLLIIFVGVKYLSMLNWLYDLNLILLGFKSARFQFERLLAQSSKKHTISILRVEIGTTAFLS